MEQSFVIYRFLFPTDENPPEAIYPGGDTFDHPASSAAASGAFGGLFFPARLDVRPVAASAASVSGGQRKYLTKIAELATSTVCRESDRIVAADISKVGGAHGVVPTPGSTDAGNCRSRIPAEPLSIGNRCVIRRKYRRRLFAIPTVAIRQGKICGTWVKKIPFWPRVRLEYASLDTFFQRAYENPP
jgi:hypothetical protein